MKTIHMTLLATLLFAFAAETLHAEEVLGRPLRNFTPMQTEKDAFLLKSILEGVDLTTPNFQLPEQVQSMEQAQACLLVALQNRPHARILAGCVEFQGWYIFTDSRHVIQNPGAEQKLLISSYFMGGYAIKKGTATVYYYSMAC